MLPDEPIQFHFSGATKTHFLKTYGKGGDIFEVKMQEESPLENLTVSEFEAGLDASCSVLAVLQENELYFPPLRNLKITASSLVAIMGTKAKVQEFAEEYKLKLYHRLTAFAEILHPVRAGLCEAVIPPSSALVGQELREVHMKRNYQIHVLALLRGQTLYQKEALMDLTLRPGDTLGMFCRWEALADFHKNPDFVVLTTDYPREELRPKKMWFAIFFFLLSMGLIVFGNFPVSVGLFLGAVGMVATGVLSMDEAYETVSWRTVFLIAGLIPLGLALQVTHTTDWLTQYMVLLNNLPLWVLMAILAMLASLLSFFISGVGSTVVLVPMAIELATTLHADPRQMALVVAIAASNIFSAPSYQANALIAGPGNYQTKDFLRAGSGMMILYWITMLLVIYWLF